MTDRDDELAHLRDRLQISENTFRELVLYRKEDQRKLGLADTQLRKWAMAIVKAGIERFPDPEIVAEAEAHLKEFQDDLITYLKGGRRKIPPKASPYCRGCSITRTSRTELSGMAISSSGGKRICK